MNKTGKGCFKPKQSGNPAGRPPKARALSDALRARCAPSYEALSELLLSVALTGEVKTASGEVTTATLRERIDVIKFLYAQIDGPPPKAKEEIGLTDDDIGNLTDAELAALIDN